jgi:hypothetical protein
MWLSEAAGRRPLSRSSALALTARVRAGEGSPSNVESTQAIVLGSASA